MSGPGAVLVFLGVRGRLPQLAHHSLFFTQDWHANFDAIFTEPTRVPEPASLYVCRPSRPTIRWRRASMRICSSWYPYRPIPRWGAVVSTGQAIP